MRFVSATKSTSIVVELLSLKYPIRFLKGVVSV